MGFVLDTAYYGAGSKSRSHRSFLLIHDLAYVRLFARRLVAYKYFINFFCTLWVREDSVSLTLHFNTDDPVRVIFSRMTTLHHPNLGELRGRLADGVAQYRGIKYGSLEHRFGTPVLYQGSRLSVTVDATEHGFVHHFMGG